MSIVSNKQGRKSRRTGADWALSLSCCFGCIICSLLLLLLPPFPRLVSQLWVHPCQARQSCIDKNVLILFSIIFFCGKSKTHSRMGQRRFTIFHPSQIICNPLSSLPFRSPPPSLPHNPWSKTRCANLTSPVKREQKVGAEKKLFNIRVFITTLPAEQAAV